MNPLAIILRIMPFPITKVPPKLHLSLYSCPSSQHFLHNLSENIDSLCFHQLLPQIMMNSQSSRHHLEQMSSHTRIRCPRIFFSQLKILQSQTVKTQNLIAEKSRILQQRLRTHHSINVSFHKAFSHILKAVDSSISQNRNIQSLFNFSDHLPVTTAYSIFVLFFCSSMNCQQFASSFLNSMDQLQGLLLIFQNTNFAKNGNFNILGKSLDHFLYKFRLFQQKRTIVPFSSYSLRTSQIYINSINFLLQHLSSFYHRLWVIATQLSDERPVLRTRSKMLLLIIFSCYHHFRMQHRSVTEVSSISSCEQSEWQL